MAAVRKGFKFTAKGAVGDDSTKKASSDELVVKSDKRKVKNDDVITVSSKKARKSSVQSDEAEIMDDRAANKSHYPATAYNIDKKILNAKDTDKNILIALINDIINYEIKGLNAHFNNDAKLNEKREIVDCLISILKEVPGRIDDTCDVNVTFGPEGVSSSKENQLDDLFATLATLQSHSSTLSTYESNINQFLEDYNILVDANKICDESTLHIKTDNKNAISHSNKFKELLRNVNDQCTVILNETDTIKASMSKALDIQSDVYNKYQQNRLAVPEKQSKDIMKVLQSL